MAVVNGSFYLLEKKERTRQKEDLRWRVEKGSQLYRSYLLLEISKRELQKGLKELQLRMVSAKKWEELKKDATPIKIGKVEIIDKYGYYPSPFTPLLFEDLKESTSNLPYYLVVNLMLLFYFFWLYRKLQPLKEIARQIRLVPAPTPVEIPPTFCELEGIVQQLNLQTSQLEALNSSRRFLLRTLFHELLTPLTKIKLTASLLDNPKQRERIERSVARIEKVIKELKSVEFLLSRQQLTPNLLPLTLEEVAIRGVELALGKVPIETIKNGEILGDITYLEIGVKNLVDNCLKYGKRCKIIISHPRLEVRSRGKPLARPFEEYLRPFNHKYEGEGNGLGLGLYIVSQIAKLHKAVFTYHRQGEWNIFSLTFTHFPSTPSTPLPLQPTNK